MTKKTKKTKLVPLSFKELNNLRGGSPPRMIIPPRDPD